MTAAMAARTLLRTLAVAILLCAGLCAGMTAAPAQAQQGATQEAGAEGGLAPDYAGWARVAADTDRMLADAGATVPALERRRTLIAGWRETFLAGQGANAGRIATLRDQIAALGPAPAEGKTEAADIAARRTALNRDLSDLQAPGLAAVEAYSRADGLIRQIDAALRQRTARQFLARWPTPLNPVNWPAAWGTVVKAVAGIAGEVAAVGAGSNGARANLPFAAGLLVLAAVLILAGRRVFERFALRLAGRASTRAQGVWSFLVSLGQIAVPMLGMLALASALALVHLSGPAAGALPRSLIVAGAVAFAFRWLGEQGFPKVPAPGVPVRMTPERRAEGRFLTRMMGLLMGLTLLREGVVPLARIAPASAAVIAFPWIVLASMVAYRLGHILTRDTGALPGDDMPNYRSQIVALVGRGAMVVALAAPLLAAAGYVPAARGVLFPTVASMAVIGALFTLQRFTGDLYALFTRSGDEDAKNALAPVLIGFVLTLAALPLLALIWGARTSDLTELLARFREGFTIGSTRISPSDFVLLAVIFAIGLALTRLLQSAMRTSILPKTRLDAGGRNAILAGTGYLGIFLAALVAIDAAGIDLSGLAIVAGALSVGIGFGLQNIVSNFVSGIILLIERPVSEGDWIEVGGVQGTVKAISVRSTRILTFDRTDVIVPNSDLVSGVVTNWTHFSLAGRLIVKVGVAYGTDTRKVERILREIAEAQPMAILNPPPQVVLMAFGADSLDFEIRLILRDVNFSVPVRSEINHEIARRFGEEGIEIPFGQRDIWLRNPEALAATMGRGPREAASGPPATGAVEHREGGPRDPHAEGAVIEDAYGDAGGNAR